MRESKFWFWISRILIVLMMALTLPIGAAASTYKVLHKFKGGPDGSLPEAGLVLDAAGNLYGTTPDGGVDGFGTVFKLAPNSDGSWTESVLYTFTGGTDGGQPTVALIFDAVGNLYGTTAVGGLAFGCSGGIFLCGTVFKLAPNSDGSWTESVLYSFAGGADGADPMAGLIFDGAGNLYSTTFYGGLSGFGGTVFKLTPQSDGNWTNSVLYNFCSLNNCADGNQTSAGLVFDGAGNLYGSTPAGGSCCGVVFKLTPNSNGSWTESVLHSFSGGADGAGPSRDLIFDGAGNLYGTALTGGNLSDCNGSGCGVVFKLSPNLSGWKEQVLHRFAGKEAAFPRGLIFDAVGNLYGAATFGGHAGGGAIFKLAPQSNGSWAYSVLHVFLGRPAMNPLDNPVLDKTGNLYGTTEECGRRAGCQGVVFEITP